MDTSTEIQQLKNSLADARERLAEYNAEQVEMIAALNEVMLAAAVFLATNNLYPPEVLDAMKRVREIEQRTIAAANQ